MKIKSIILFSAFILISSIMAVESEGDAVNEKYAFIKEIYDDSWALIIGINKYENVDPLSYAVDDAEAVNDILTRKYGFKEENVRLITDEEATKIAEVEKAEYEKEKAIAEKRVPVGN